jgi:hypothetical protein
MEDWNKAAILKHIWNIFSQAGSLWVAWVKEYILKGRSFWTIKESLKRKVPTRYTRSIQEKPPN